jgi:ligand-binding sensor domain-containing protein
MRLILFLLACTRAQTPPRPKLDPPKLTAVLTGPRVAELLTAGGDIRDALPVGETIWLATAGGLVRASQDLIEEARFTTLDGLPSVDLWALAAKDDLLYVASAVGVIEIRITSGRPVDARLLGMPRARAVALVDGVLWAGSWGTLARWDGARFLPLVNLPLQVNRIVADGKRLWVASAQGLLRIDGDQLKWFQKKDGLPDDFVWDVGDGVVETMGGPAILERDFVAPQPGPTRRRRPIPFLDGQLLLDENGLTRKGMRLRPLGLPSPDVTALAVGDDALYVGTFDRGVAVVRWQRDEGTLSIEPIEGLIDARINALAVRREELWVATARGASRVRAGTITHFTTADGLPSDHVNAIVADGDIVRLATTHGYVEIGPAGIKPVTVETGLPVTRLYALARGSDGALWVGGARGAARLGSEWSTARALTGELPDDFVTALLPFGDDLWVGTYASGLARRTSARVWTQLAEPEIPSNWINPGALAAWRERIWAGTVERGLMVSPRQRPGDREGRWTTLVEGLPSADVTALAADDDGLWVGTRGGVARVVMPMLVGGL